MARVSMRPAIATTLVEVLLSSATASRAYPAAPEGRCPSSSVPWADGSCEPLKTAAADAEAYLRSHEFSFDKPSEATYFDGGIAVTSVALALRARQRFGWAASVPKDLWQAYVLPAFVVNEARTNWRQFMWDALVDQPWLVGLSNASSLANVTLMLNDHCWTDLRAAGQSPIRFKAEQTPLIFDAMSTITFGYASCTGISITFVNALRTLGIPARLVGTPAWHGIAKDGNHNWVEVWTGRAWQFIEGRPAGPGESLSNPCDKWFCHPDHFSGNGTGTRVFATTCGNAATGGAHYPMDWDLGNRAVAGIDRTEYYDRVCGACK